MVAGYTHAHSNFLVILTLIAYLSSSDVKLNYALYYIAGFAGEGKTIHLERDHPADETKYPYCRYRLLRLFLQLRDFASSIRGVSWHDIVLF